MANNPGQQVDVDFKASGLGKLKAQWADFAGELIEPMAILAAGGTKAQAAWAGMRGIFLTKVLGPMGMVTGAAVGLLLVTRKLVSEWRQVGVAAAKSVETLTLQFKPLLGSMELAKKRAREVFDFTVKSPFRFEEVAEGNKMLEALTKGALAAEGGMTLVGDAAAVSGQAFTDVARYVGRLYDGLMAGRPVGEATMRLQEMGLISGQLRNQIESMQAANASGNDIWRAVSKELERNKGAMDALSESLAGLESTYEDTKQKLEAGFGQGFMEGEKAAVKSTIGVMEKMVPVAQYFGEMFGTVANAVARFKARVVELATGFPGFSQAVTAAAGAVLLLSAGVVAASGALLGKFVLGILSAVQASQQLSDTIEEGVDAQRLLLAVTGKLEAAKLALTAAMAAARAGTYAEMVAQLRLAVAETIAAVRTNVLAASQMILRGTLHLTGQAVVFVTRQLAGMALALAAMPVFWLATALVAAGAALMHFAIKTRKAQEELAAFQKAGRDTLANLDAQRRAIRTVNDLRAAEAAALAAVTQAHLDYRNAVEGGDAAKIGAAEKQLDAAKQELAKIRATPRSGLDKTDPQIEREDALRDARKQAEESARDFKAQRGPAAERDEASADFGRKSGAMGRAEAELKAEESVREKQRKLQQQAEDLAPREAELVARRGALDPFDGDDQGELARVEAELKKISRLRAEAEGGASALGLGSGSELMVLQEKVKLYDEMQSSITAAAAARKRIQDIDTTQDDWEIEGDRAGVAFKAAADAARAARAAAGAAGVGEASGFNRLEATRRVGLLEKQRTESLDPARVEEARQRAVTAELGLIRARLEGEQQVVSLRLRGFEKEEALLDLEQQKLAAARERGRIDQDSYARQKQVLDAQREALGREAAERGKAIQGAFRIQQLDRQEQEARNSGDTVKAEALRLARERVQDEQARADAEREARELDLSPGQRTAFAEDRVAEDRAGRDAARRRDEEARGLSREGSRATAGSAVAALQEQVLRRQGRTEEAKRVKEEAARKQDDVDRREARRRLIDQGMGEKEAGQMADQEVKTNQAARLMEQFGNGGATIVADSLAAVGGGGGVAGVDASERHLERMVRLLEELKDNTKPDLDMGGW